MKQTCTFPYAYRSTPRFNARAYVTQIDGNGKPDFFRVWSPVHVPHLVGRYKTKQAAQVKADQINAMGEFIYVL